MYRLVTATLFAAFLFLSFYSLIAFALSRKLTSSAIEAAISAIVCMGLILTMQHIRDRYKTNGRCTS